MTNTWLLSDECHLIQNFFKENLNVYSSYRHKICFPEHDLVKFGYSEKATEFEKIFHLKFDALEKRI